MTIKEFVKEFKPKKMSGDDIRYILESNQKEIIEFVIKDAHKQKYAEMANELYKKLATKKVAKALKKISKSDEGLDCGFAVVIANMFEKIHNMKDVEIDEEVKDVFIGIINKILKPRIKTINKKLDLDPEVIKELLIITPDVGYISDEKFVSFYSQKMLRKLYMLTESKEVNLTEPKQVKQLFSKLFGKKLLDVIAVHILLEKREFSKNFSEKQKALWNLMTKFALDTIENQDKNHIIELLEYYCNLRKKHAQNNRDGVRRIDFNEIKEDEYPKLCKNIKNFRKNSKESLTKFL